MNSQGQTFGNGRFTDPRFSNQDGVVFFAATENLRNPLNFSISTDDGVQTAFFGQLRQIPPKIIQDRGLAFGIGRLTGKITGCLFLILSIGVFVRSPGCGRWFTSFPTFNHRIDFFLYQVIGDIKFF